ncbi:ABC transporter permease [Paenibacillus sp. JNUCC32]|uniref:ABC transporter permease n=1 Tax=Paenibacillus sp. JNUCC32 TaxID=2777984 RepID=UPI0017886D22|nr:ABC transporter permease [Paenibacillus sp. JNUCC-32]QOT11157.1 ABC transporter permease [Paenibacillus sp. JNUCC-32]
MLVFRMTYFSLLRLIREPIGQLLLVGLPLVVITVLGVVIGPYEGMKGVPPLELMAVTTIMGVQFFGGTYLMSYLDIDLLKTRKWRIYSLPINVAVYSSSLILACTLFSTLQGLVLVLFTTWVFGITWGSLGWVLLVLIIYSFFAQSVHLLLTLSIHNIKLAERVSEVLGIGFIILTGLMFPLPDHRFFEFMSSYGNPVSLGKMAVLEMLVDGGQDKAYLSILLLLALTVICMMISAWLGRRKLA